jgi:eukaryotic-like serine/threonine-protein kinase
MLDGRYRIQALLGSGGMGRVYRAEHTGIGRQVAIKVLNADQLRNRDAAQRFQREALASGRLDHPNIVAVSDFGIIDRGPCYLVMEVLDGESVGTRLQREQRIPWAEAVSILRSVLAGLRHAHDRGVVHRDIKPDNVFLARKDGEQVVKILDFGIAKLRAGTADDPAATRAGLTVGTPAYLSPEQAVGGEITPASDLYSVTVVLFEMITGRPPFQDADPLAMLGAHVSRPAPRIQEIAPELGVPSSLEAVIEKGLEKSAADRIRSAAQYLTLLDDAVGIVVPRSSASQPVAVPIGLADTVVGSPTPVPGATANLTPVPATSTSVLATSVPATTASEGAIPAKWIKVGKIVVAALSVVAVTLAIVSRGSDSKQAKPQVVNVPVFDREKELKALLHDLESGKTCEDRKAAIDKLVSLGDKRAIQPLRTARYRMRGGVLGLGADNTNGCLKADAEAAIKALGGTIREQR